MESLERLYEEAGKLHGSVCSGIVLGVRMAHLACRLLGIDEPRGPEDRKKLIVFVEIDRCATDGIQSVTGCTIGKRTLKIMDYGLMAATFRNEQTSQAYRISVRPDSRQRAKELFPHLTDKNHVYLEGYKQLPDDELFVAEPVQVDLSGMDLPGPPPGRAQCHQCGEEIIAGREIMKDEHVLCRRCAGMPVYYSSVSRDPAE
ncbi:MAG TPA: FmdE family protein [Thermodesulfobacteriota bacterium]|nr:FmdE family protein [Thermodesulfobacteriota bacterium]HNU71805.1 FmdE family protein [Thermodesulfobacteriota bacterium]